MSDPFSVTEVLSAGSRRRPRPSWRSAGLPCGYRLQDRRRARHRGHETWCFLRRASVVRPCDDRVTVRAEGRCEQRRYAPVARTLLGNGEADFHRRIGPLAIEQKHANRVRRCRRRCARRHVVGGLGAGGGADEVGAALLPVSDRGRSASARTAGAGLQQLLPRKRRKRIRAVGGGRGTSPRHTSAWSQRCPSRSGSAGRPRASRTPRCSSSGWLRGRSSSTTCSRSG